MSFATHPPRDGLRFRLQPLIDLIFPPRCVARGCGRRGSWLCDACRAAIQPLPAGSCQRCALRSDELGPCLACLRRPMPFARCFAAGAYEAPLSDAIRAFKYRRQVGLAPILAGLAANAIASDRHVDRVVALPSHPSRVAERGIDHTARLAVGVAERIGLPLASDCLRRRRATQAQVGRSASARAANVAGAFTVGSEVGCQGLRILLVDDVMTTGATASEATRALIQAGAASVDLCLVARALPPRLVGTRPDHYNSSSDRGSCGLRTTHH